MSTERIAQVAEVWRRPGGPPVEVIDVKGREISVLPITALQASFSAIVVPAPEFYEQYRFVPENEQWYRLSHQELGLVITVFPRGGRSLRETARRAGSYIQMIQRRIEDQQQSRSDAEKFIAMIQSNEWLQGELRALLGPADEGRTEA